jgi:tryptophan synthase alpha chain
MVLAKRRQLRPLLVPYVTAGYIANWLDVALRLATNGAVDALEIGLPFSDPVMDGPVIQRASAQALDRGARVDQLVAEIASVDCPVPIAVMAYANTAARVGWSQFAAQMTDAGVGGVILPDLPVDEAGLWCNAAAGVGLAAILLAAPTGSVPRWNQIGQASTGFVYAVGSVGVTGERAALDPRLDAMLATLRQVGSTPVLVGVGISTGEHASQAAAIADGVIVGSGLMRRLMDNDVEAVDEFVAVIRQGLDA